MAKKTHRAALRALDQVQFPSALKQLGGIGATWLAFSVIYNY
jgi:hypothetical protein